MVEWRPIPGFPDYEASSAGEVRPVKPRYRIAPVETFLAEIVGEKIERRGLVLRPWINTRHRRESASVTLHIGGERHKEFVHRLVCLAFHGEPPPGMTDCCHKNHNSLDNRAENLKWDTHANNVAESFTEEAIERRSRWEDAVGYGPCYTEPDSYSDVPF